MCGYKIFFLGGGGYTYNPFTTLKHRFVISKHKEDFLITIIDANSFYFNICKWYRSPFVWGFSCSTPVFGFKCRGCKNCGLKN